MTCSPLARIQLADLVVGRTGANLRSMETLPAYLMLAVEVNPLESEH